MTLDSLYTLEDTKEWLYIFIAFHRHQPTKLTENEYLEEKCQRYYNKTQDTIEEIHSIMAAMVGAVGLFQFGEFKYAYKILDYYDDIKKKKESTVNRVRARLYAPFMGGVNVLRILPLPDSMWDHPGMKYRYPVSVHAMRQWLKDHEHQLEYDDKNFCYRLIKE